MLSKIKVLLGVSLFALAFQSHAAHYPVTATQEVSVTGTVVIDDDPVSGAIDANGGNIAGSDDWVIAKPYPADSDVSSAVLHFASQDITGLAVYSRETGSAGTWANEAQSDSSPTGVGSGYAATVILELLSSHDYFVRVFGDAGSRYQLEVTQVPLPAAAWLFLSALGIYGVAGRKKRQMQPALA